MGIIACTTPSAKVHFLTPRSDVTPSEIGELGKINISYFKFSDEDVSVRTYDKLDLVKFEDKQKRIDLLSKVIWTVRPHKPAWSGFMQLLQSSL